MSNLVKSCRMLCGWIDQNIQEFRPSSGEGLNSFTHVKPFGELVLVLYSFASPEESAKETCIGNWVRCTGDLLARTAESFGKDIDWNRIPAAAGKSPDAASALFIFPALKAITGTGFSWERQVTSALYQIAPAGFSECPALSFAHDLAGLGNCYDLCADLIEGFLHAHRGKMPSYLNLYKLTHFIFFGTQMGKRALMFPASVSAQLEKQLLDALKVHIEKGNLDLVAEIILCLTWLGCDSHFSYEYGLNLLASRVLQGTDSFSFSDDYHLNLVTLAALGHSIRQEAHYAPLVVNG